MRDVYDTLRQLKFFIDNEYLKKYCQIIERHSSRQPRFSMIHKHHIIPRCWFKLNNLTVDDSLSNLVRLPTRDHFLAHYYLCLCTADPFKYGNELALSCLLSSKHIKPSDKQLLQRLPMYNIICEDTHTKQEQHYQMYSEDLYDNKRDH